MSLSNSADFGVIRAVTATGVGAPLAIMSDRQNSGGYPKIASLIDIDHRAFAKLRPAMLSFWSGFQWRKPARSGPAVPKRTRRQSGEPRATIE